MIAPAQRELIVSLGIVLKDHVSRAAKKTVVMEVVYVT
jgi:hypothetical protein